MYIMLNELHDYYEQHNISETELQTAAVYIEQYTEVLFDMYDIEYTQEELEKSSIYLYYCLLQYGKKTAEEMDTMDLESVFMSFLADFDTSDDDYSQAMSNMHALLGLAGTKESFRTKKIVQLGEQIFFEEFGDEYV